MKMTATLKGKVAIVTGSGQGIGRAIAFLMAQEGASVVVNDLGCAPDGTGTSTTLADEVVNEIKSNGWKAIANHDSVITMDGGQRIVNTAVDSFGRLDILVNNAGAYRLSMLEDMTEEDWDIVIATHLKGQFTCIKHAIPIMKRQKSGRIINIASESALGHPGQAQYSTAKAGVLGLTRTLALELGQYGITCNAIRPRAATKTVNSYIRDMAKYFKIARVPLPTFFLGSPDKWRPEDVAPFIVYLATNEAANINGYDFAVYDGTVSLMSKPQAVKSIYHPGGRWTVDELINVVPTTLAVDLVNPSPPLPEA